MYFENFIKGINSIYFKEIEEIYGNNYKNDQNELIKISKEDRNKIFHGQITNKFLERSELIEKIEIIKRWCEKIAIIFTKEIGYDGFERNSYRKANSKLNLKNVDKFSTIDNYKKFLKTIDRSKK